MAEKKGKKISGFLIAAIAVFVALAALIAGFTVFALKVRDMDTIYPNVWTLGVNLGGLTREEAEKALLDAGVDVYHERELRVEVEGCAEAGFTVTAEELGLTLPVYSYTKAPYDHGRGGNIFQNAVAYLKCKFGALTDIPAERTLTLDSAVIAAKVRAAAEKADYAPTQPYITLGSESVSATKGISGRTLDREKLESEIYSCFADRNYPSPLVCVPARVEPAEINASQVLAAAGKDPVEPEYDKALGAFKAEKPGVTIDLVAAEDAINALGEGETAELPLLEVAPQNTKAAMDAVLFRDTLATSVSILQENPDRTDNVVLAASKIDLVVLAPGESFSYNSLVGPYTEAAGYKKAAAYLYGEVVQDWGGGVCQLASGVYFCTLYSNLKVLERECHQFAPVYFDKGLDATVGDYYPDYRFRNNTLYPVRIHAWVSGNELHVEFHGTNLSGEYVKMDSAVISEIPWEIVYTVDEGLAAGQWYYVAYGHSGYEVETFREVYSKDGKLLKRTLEDVSVYSKSDVIIARSKYATD